MYIADLHIHSRFSRATSKDGDLPHLDWWARRKGIRMVGTGDFTHPAWRAELREQLVPAGEGVYTLRQDLRLPDVAPGEAPRFVITGEISCIYKRHGRHLPGRGIHPRSHLDAPLRSVWRLLRLRYHGGVLRGSDRPHPRGGDGPLL